MAAAVQTRRGFVALGENWMYETCARRKRKINVIVYNIPRPSSSLGRRIKFTIFKVCKTALSLLRVPIRRTRALQRPYAAQRAGFYLLVDPITTYDRYIPIPIPMPTTIPVAQSLDEYYLGPIGNTTNNAERTNDGVFVFVRSFAVPFLLLNNNTTTNVIFLQGKQKTAHDTTTMRHMHALG